MEPGQHDPQPVMARPVTPAVLDFMPAPASPPPPENPLLLRGVEPRAAGWDVFLVLMICVAGPYLPRFLIEFVSPDQDLTLDKVGPAIVLMKWAELLVAAAIAMYLVGRTRLRADGLGCHEISLGKQILWGFGGLFAAYGYMILTVVFVMLMPSNAQNAIGGDLEERLKFVDAMPLNDLRLTLALLIPVAIHEELVFRALLLPLLRRATGSWVVAVGVSAVVFGSLHISQGMFAIVQITGLGIIFSLIFIRSRSLLAVVIAHFLFDFLQFQLMRLTPLLQQIREAAEQQQS